VLLPGRLPHGIRASPSPAGALDAERARSIDRAHPSRRSCSSGHANAGAELKLTDQLYLSEDRPQMHPCCWDELAFLGAGRGLRASRG